jgi:hypothetical protein
VSSPLWAERRFTSTCVVEGCGAPIPKGKRKCLRHLKLKGKTSQGRPVTKGSNARGIAAHKPDRSRTRRAKRQNPQVMGVKPTLRVSHMSPARAPATKRDRELW